MHHPNFRNLFLLLFTTATLAQEANVPSCALNCIITGYSKTGCALADYACQCVHIDQLWGTVTPCIKSACSDSDVQKVRDATVPFCKQYGVDVTLPSEGATASATATVVVGASGSATSTGGGAQVTSAAAPSTTVVSPTDSGAAAKVSPASTSTGQTSSDSSNNRSSGGSKPPIGAIVGGVVGGLAILCVAGVALFYIKRRHPRGTQDAAAPAKSEPVLPKYEYSTAPETVQPGQGRPEVTYGAQPAPAYGASELGGHNMGYAAELPAVRK